MFTENFLQSIRNRKYHTGHIQLDYDMYDFLKYAYSHPSNYAIWYDNEKRLSLEGMETRGKTPQFAKDIIQTLKQNFTKNNITCHAFSGFTEESKSFKIHKDRMDVFYLQVVGEIEWSIWKSDLNDSIIEPENGKCVFKEKFIPGNYIWIPRETYHFVEPITPRVGFSFGVENDPEPSTYI